MRRCSRKCDPSRRTVGAPGRANPGGRSALRAVALLVLLAGTTLPPAAAAEDAGVAVAGPEDVWVISTRRVGWSGCLPPESEELDFSRSRDCRWEAANLDEFRQSLPPGRRIVCFVHGNRVEPAQARREGWDVYQALLREAPDTPFRFVIWSWPSDRIPGVLRDARAKATRAHVEGRYLAGLVAQTDPASPLSLLGYSFGARVVTGCLHVVGGGELPSANPLVVPTRRAPVHVALLAAATHDDWLLPQGRYDRAWSQTASLLVMYNPCDRVLRRYEWLDRGRRPRALGFTGLPGWQQLEGADTRLQQQDVSGLIGRTHQIEAYLRSREVQGRLRAALLPEPGGD